MAIIFVGIVKQYILMFCAPQTWRSSAPYIDEYTAGLGSTI
jgi:hypothetical protein